jgi:hypothetical protein
MPRPRDGRGVARCSVLHAASGREVQQLAVVAAKGRDDAGNLVELRPEVQQRLVAAAGQRAGADPRVVDLSGVSEGGRQLVLQQEGASVHQPLEVVRRRDFGVEALRPRPGIMADLEVDAVRIASVEVGDLRQQDAPLTGPVVRLRQPEPAARVLGGVSERDEKHRERDGHEADVRVVVGADVDHHAAGDREACRADGCDGFECQPVVGGTHETAGHRIGVRVDAETGHQYLHA